MTSEIYPNLRELVAVDDPEAYRTMLELGPVWYEEMAEDDPERLLAVAELTPAQIATHRLRWSDDPGGWLVDPETGDPLDSEQYPMSPEDMESARAFTSATDTYYESGDMTGLQKLGIFPPAGDPAYEELGFSGPASNGE